MANDQAVAERVSGRHGTGVLARLALTPRHLFAEADPGRISHRTADVVPCDARNLRKVDRNHVLFWQGGLGIEVIRVVEGVVRAVHLTESGERQVLAFFWPGTVIHPDLGQRQFYTAETVTACVLQSTGRTPIAVGSQVTSADRKVLAEVLDLVGGIGRRCALSRTAWFLLRMRGHLPRAGLHADVLKFLLPRADIADHLGLSLETVSRCLTELKLRNAIDLPDRKTIRFANVAELARIARA